MLRSITISRKIAQKYSPYFLKFIYRLIYNMVFALNCYINRGVKVHLYAGIPLNIYIFNSVSKRWYDHDQERAEIRFLQKGKLKKGARVFNVGAHQGIISLIFSKIVGESGSVIAIEMNEDHVWAAEINKKNNDAFNLKIINAAVGYRKGRIAFRKDQIVTNENLAKPSVKTAEVISVDDLTKKYGKPDLLYMDVEGYECNVLKGAKETLTYSPDFFIEVHVKNGLEAFNGSIKEILSFFPKTKYELYMSAPTDDCLFQKFNSKSILLADRFFLAALAKYQNI